MKLTHYLALLPLTMASFSAMAEENAKAKNNSVFRFSTQVSRTVEKDLMQADVYSRKSGKNLADLKKTVSANLNGVLENAKKYSDIEISAEGLSNYADYDNKGKVTGWVAEGHINLKGKNFESIAKVLDELGADVAISQVNFSVSPEKMASLEDEMTLEIIQQFQHKADVIQKGLKAQKYTLRDIQLNTPNGGMMHSPSPRMYKAAAVTLSADSQESVPLEAGKTTISATASGEVVFE
ncbi:hypothetical protein A4G19_02960 [Pasteurellaceae bacterium Macca]|nr:hypothetical protein [Pasteurellaceae bacterium Macca]